MPKDSRDDRIADLAREDTEDAELANGETPEQLKATIDKLRQLRDRVEQQQLGPDDWALLATLIKQEMK